MSLLDTIEEILPLGMEDWVRVERRHRVRYHDRNRTGAILHRKFRALYLANNAKGDPNIPPHFNKKAKELHEAIKKKFDMVSVGAENNEAGEQEEEAEIEDADKQDVPPIKRRRRSDSTMTTDEDPPAATSGSAKETKCSTRRHERNVAAFAASSHAVSQVVGTTRSARKGKRGRSEEDLDDISLSNIMKFIMLQRMFEMEDRRLEMEERRREREERRVEMLQWRQFEAEDMLERLRFEREERRVEMLQWRQFEAEDMLERLRFEREERRVEREIGRDQQFALQQDMFCMMMMMCMAFR